MNKIHRTVFILNLVCLTIFTQFKANATNSSFVFISDSTLLPTVYPSCLNAYSINNTINLHHVREVCNFLTNIDIISYRSCILPKRNKAFIRYVKQINEKLETDFQNLKQVDGTTLNLFFELELLSESFKQKATANVNTKVRLSDKINMLLHATISPYVFCYTNKVTNNEAKNINANNLGENPTNSIFWNNNLTNACLDKRFSALAKLKKIKAKKNMVVVFDKASLSGSAPKINVLDLDIENKWSLKWGDEVHTDAVGSAVFAALGLRR
jgi:hypothetical protein